MASSRRAATARVISRARRNTVITALRLLQHSFQHLPLRLWAEVASFLDTEAMLSLTTTSHHFLNVQGYILDVILDEVAAPRFFSWVFNFDWLRSVTLRGTIFCISNTNKYTHHPVQTVIIMTRKSYMKPWQQRLPSLVFCQLYEF